MKRLKCKICKKSTFCGEEAVTVICSRCVNNKMTNINKLYEHKNEYKKK